MSNRKSAAKVLGARLEQTRESVEVVVHSLSIGGRELMMHLTVGADAVLLAQVYELEGDGLAGVAEVTLDLAPEMPAGRRPRLADVLSLVDRLPEAA